MRNTISEAMTSLVPAPETTDGRMLRRTRNMDSVRCAVVELLSEGADLNIPLVARRAGVAGRSVYRYYGDLDSAVRDAAISRLDEALALEPDPASVDPARPFSERIEHMSRARVEMWWIAAPVLGSLPAGVLEAERRRLDTSVVTTFAPELDGFDCADRVLAESALTVLARMQTIGLLAGRCDFDIDETMSALGYAMRRLLSPLP
jgi:AcrR family transcriptional regulator